MGIKVKIPSLSGLEDMLRSQLTAVDNAIIYRLEVLGEKCVAEAREHHGYTDRTGNLTSSIGYVIAKDGEIVRQGGFAPVHGQYENMQHVQYKTKTGKMVDYWAKGQSGDGSKGAAEGPAFAREQVSKYPKGYVLIIVAGMNYAVYVADKGYNVLDSAEILAGKEAPRMMQELGLRG